MRKSASTGDSREKRRPTELERRFGEQLRRLRRGRPPRVYLDLAAIPEDKLSERRWYDLENGQATLELDRVALVAKALNKPALDLLVPLFPKPRVMSERLNVDRARWAELARRAEDEARRIGRSLREPVAREALVALAIIAERAPEKIPVIADMLTALSNAVRPELTAMFAAQRAELQYGLDTGTLNPDELRSQRERTRERIEKEMEGESDGK